MKGVNPFEAVPSLHDFATRVAQDLKNGRRVLAVIGPYSDTKFREAVRPLAGYGDKRWRELCRVYQSTEWSEEAAGTDVLLIVAHVFHRSAGLILNGDGPVWCDVVHVCPTNLSRVELRSLAGEMLAKEKLSDVFRTMIIDFSCELCAGSISSLRDALELCLNKNYRPPSAFVHPHDVVKRCREEQERRTNARLEALDAEAERHDSHPNYVDVGHGPVNSFREALMRSLSTSGRPLGAPDDGSPSGNLALMWRLYWSYGLCFQMDGVWCPAWDVLMQGEQPWEPVGGNNYGASRTSSVFSDVVYCREALSAQVAFAPVWERYKSQVIARLIDTADSPDQAVGRYEVTDANGQHRSGFVRRFNDISSAYSAVEQSGGATTEEDRKCLNAFKEVRRLRNAVVHGDVQGVGRREVLELGKVLAALEAQEATPEARRYRRCFC